MSDRLCYTSFNRYIKNNTTQNPQPGFLNHLLLKENIHGRFTGETCRRKAQER